MDKKTRSKIIGGLAFIIILTLCVVGLTLTKKDNERMDKLLAMSVDNSEKNETNIDNHEEYVDLGLPSGTKWKLSNEEDPSDIEYAFYTYDDAVEHFGRKLPRPEQWMELINECQWTWNGYGYEIIGPNNNTIVLPASGYRDLGSNIHCMGELGNYWTSASNRSKKAWYILFRNDAPIISVMRGYDHEIDPNTKYGVTMDTNIREYGFSVRLVKD